MEHIYGQPRATALVSSFLSAPDSRAFLLHGPTGTGKTSTAHYLADALHVDRSPCGGFIEIASGEQSAEAVRDLSRSFRLRPMFGTWRIVIVNECDRMTAAAETIWLDVLENLPRHVVIVFTSNNIEKLSQRFANRCETIEFYAEAAAVAKFARLEWNRLRPDRQFPAELNNAGRRPNWSPSYRLAVQDVRQAAALADIAPTLKESPPVKIKAAATIPDVSATPRKKSATIPHLKNRPATPAAKPRGMLGWIFG